MNHPQTILDRLLDRPAQVGDDVATVIASVKEDLRLLLNTRHNESRLDANDPIRRSILSYGLPDFSGQTAFELRDGQWLREAIRDAIDRFEPRLIVAKDGVTIETGNSVDQVIRVSIRAQLVSGLAGPPSPVRFETVLHLKNREIVVKGGPDDGSSPGSLQQ